MIKALIYDLDGTLIDSLQDLRSAVNHTLREHGFPERTTAETMSFVGNGVGVLIDQACPAGTPSEKVAQCLAEFRQYYFAHSLEQTAPYPGIPELLQRCHEAGLQNAVVSNKFEQASLHICDRLLPGLVDVVVGDLPGYPRKPDPANIRRCLDQLGAAADEVLYVGDSETDILTARNAGLRMITVTWGFRSREILTECGAGNMADTVEELWEKIRETER